MEINKVPAKPILIFDLDGVITSEQVYWDSAGAAVDSLLPKRIGNRASIPVGLIAEVKSRAINSNWDLAYLALCCRLLACLRFWGEDWENSHQYQQLERQRESGFGDALSLFGGNHDLSCGDLIASLSDGGNEMGFAFLTRMGLAVEKRMPFRDGRFAHGGREWQAIQNLCQDIHDQTFQFGGEFAHEQPAVELTELRKVLRELIESWNAELGIATGRTRAEAKRALGQFGLRDFFCPQRIVCYDDIPSGNSASLAKPHPYSILRAVFPGSPSQVWTANSGGSLAWAAYIGDGISDVIAAKSAGVTSLGVLSGVPDIENFRSRRHAELLSAGCDCVVPTVLEVPNSLYKMPGWRVNK